MFELASLVLCTQITMGLRRFDFPKLDPENPLVFKVAVEILVSTKLDCDPCMDARDYSVAKKLHPCPGLPPPQFASAPSVILTRNPSSSSQFCRCPLPLRFYHDQEQNRRERGCDNYGPPANPDYTRRRCNASFLEADNLGLNGRRGGIARRAVVVMSVAVARVVVAARLAIIASVPATGIVVPSVVVVFVVLAGVVIAARAPELVVGVGAGARAKVISHRREVVVVRVGSIELRV